MTDVMLHYLAPVGTACYVCGATDGLQRVESWLLCTPHRTALAEIEAGEVPHPRRTPPPARRKQRRGPRSGR